MTSDLRIRILVSHTDPIAHAGLSSAFGACDDFEVVGEAAGALGTAVDIVATDFEHGLELLSPASAGRRGAKVLIITTSDRECDIRRALKQGAQGYLLQGCSLEELATAIRETSAGNIYLGTQVAHRLAESIYEDALTAREEQVLRHVVEGLCNKDIAKAMSLAVGTVKSHLRTVFGKLNVKSRTHAVAVAERRGLVGGGHRGSAPPAGVSRVTGASYQHAPIVAAQHLNLYR